MATEADIYATFADLAQRYCTLIEDPSIHGQEGLALIRDSLLPLYTAALALPAISASLEMKIAIEHAEWKARFDSLQQRLPVDIYWDKFDPFDETERELAISHSLADDLADVWRDLAKGLRELRLNASNKQAVWWEWRFSFHSHWGPHAIGALRAMHYALQDSY